MTLEALEMAYARRVSALRREQEARGHGAHRPSHAAPMVRAERRGRGRTRRSPRRLRRTRADRERARVGDAQRAPGSAGSALVAAPSEHRPRDGAVHLEGHVDVDASAADADGAVEVVGHVLIEGRREEDAREVVPRGRDVEREEGHVCVRREGASAPPTWVMPRCGGPRRKPGTSMDCTVTSTRAVLRALGLPTRRPRPSELARVTVAERGVITGGGGLRRLHATDARAAKEGGSARRE